VDSRYRITEKDKKNLLGRRIKKRAKGDLGLVGESLGLIKNNYFRGCIAESALAALENGVER
jgi:hypothetical protein